MNGFDSEPVAMQKSNIPVFQPENVSWEHNRHFWGSWAAESSGRLLCHFTVTVERPVLGTKEFSSPMHPNQGSPLFVLVCSFSALFIWGLRKVDFTLWSSYCNIYGGRTETRKNVTFQRLALMPVAQTRTCASVSWALTLLSHIFFNQVGGNPFLYRV